jgi:choline-sulfatase
MKPAVLFLTLLMVVTTLSAVESKPNVLLIFTDDHAQWAVGAYGNKDVHTPNIDRLAAEGMLFTQGFSKPVCSPSRAMLLTGQYSHRLGIPDYIPFGNPVHVDNGLPAGTATIASMLKGDGYKTGMVGKWHLGYGEKYYPENYGFESAEGYRYIAPGRQIEGVGKIPFLVNGKEIERFKNNPLHTDILADRAISFILNHSKKAKSAETTSPFFLYFALYRPHLPWNHVPEEDSNHYNNKAVAIPELAHFPNAKATDEQVRNLTRQYYANVTCADRNIGRVLNMLDKTGLAENTIVIFIGDNGFMVGHSGLLGKGNARQLKINEDGRILRTSTRANMFDDSVLVPFIIRWPGVVKPGSISDALVSTIDILPTLSEIAGVKTPLKTDGRSLLPIIKNENNSDWRNTYFDTYDMIYLGDDGEKPHMRMIRTDDWKLILYQDENGEPLSNGRRHELFNLAADPREINNLYDSDQSTPIQGKLESQLHEWMLRSEVTK